MRKTNLICLIVLSRWTLPSVPPWGLMSCDLVFDRTMVKGDLVSCLFHSASLGSLAFSPLKYWTWVFKDQQRVGNSTLWPWFPSQRLWSTTDWQTEYIAHFSAVWIFIYYYPFHALWNPEACRKSPFALLLWYSHVSLAPSKKTCHSLLHNAKMGHLWIFDNKNDGQIHHISLKIQKNIVNIPTYAFWSFSMLSSSLGFISNTIKQTQKEPILSQALCWVNICFSSLKL